mgnify:CR=1 FL=1
MHIRKFVAILALALFAATPAFADRDRSCGPISETVNPTEARATNDYINLTDGTIGTTAAAEDEYVIGTKAVFWGLYADVDVAPGSGDMWDVTVVDDGTATRLTCRISGTATNCSTTSDVEIVMAKGSDVTVLVSSASGASDPDAAAEIRVGFCVDAKR